MKPCLFSSVIPWIQRQTNVDLCRSDEIPRISSTDNEDCGQRNESCAIFGRNILIA